MNGVIICDPIDGECKYYAIGDCPSWVDSVYDGHLLTKKYNWHGMLSGGYINSIIGRKAVSRQRMILDIRSLAMMCGYIPVLHRQMGISLILDL